MTVNFVEEIPHLTEKCRKECVECVCLCVEDQGFLMCPFWWVWILEHETQGAWNDSFVQPCVFMNVIRGHSSQFFRNFPSQRRRNRHRSTQNNDDEKFATKKHMCVTISRTTPKKTPWKVLMLRLFVYSNYSGENSCAPSLMSDPSFLKLSQTLKPLWSRLLATNISPLKGTFEDFVPFVRYLSFMEGICRVSDVERSTEACGTVASQPGITSSSFPASLGNDPNCLWGMGNFQQTWNRHLEIVESCR